MSASSLDELSVNDFDDAADHSDLTTDIRSGSQQVFESAESALAAALAPLSPGARLARGTEPLQTAIDPHLSCNVALHEALTALLELESLVTRCGGFMRMEDQQVLFRARDLLRKNGRR